MHPCSLVSNFMFQIFLFEKIYSRFVSGQTLREFKLLVGYMVWWQELKGWQFPAGCGSHGMHAVLQFK